MLDLTGQPRCIAGFTDHDCNMESRGRAPRRDREFWSQPDTRADCCTSQSGDAGHKDLGGRGVHVTSYFRESSIGTATAFAAHELRELVHGCPGLPLGVGPARHHRHLAVARVANLARRFAPRLDDRTGCSCHPRRLPLETLDGLPRRRPIPASSRQAGDRRRRSPRDAQAARRGAPPFGGRLTGASPASAASAD